MDGRAHGFNDFAGETAVINFGVFRRRQGKRDFFKEDGSALDGFSTKRSLCGGELESVDDLVGESMRCDSRRGLFKL